MSRGDAENAALEAMQEEETLGKAYDARLLARLWPYLRPYKWLVVLTLVLVIPTFFIEIAPAWIIKTGLEDVVLADVGRTKPPGAIDQIMAPLTGTTIER